MQLLRKKPDRRKTLELDLEYYWSQMAYIKSATRLNSMRNYLLETQKCLEDGRLTEGFDALNRAKRELILARTKGQIYYYRNTRGMLLATTLVVVFSLGLLGFWLLQDQLVSSIVIKPQIPSFDSIALTIAPFLAALGGGIGGCAAVLIRAIDVDPELEVVSKSLWYVIKPVLGAALGLITYFAVVSGLSLLATGAKVDNFAGAVVIGFLAGFFETFSTGILARIAGQFTQENHNKEDEEVIVTELTQAEDTEALQEVLQQESNKTQSGLTKT